MLAYQQVLLYWGWCNAAYDTRGTRRVIWVNIDETGIWFGYNHKKGTVLCSEAWKDAVNPHQMHERFTLKDIRSRVTYVAAASNDAEVQRVLPQVIMTNANFATKDFQRHALEKLPDNCELWVDNSAWMNKDKFLVYLQKVHAKVQSIAIGCLLIIVVDALGCHYNDEIAFWAFSVNVIIVLIPGSMTWMLQPLDVYGLAQFKHSLLQQLCHARARTETGMLTKNAWIDIVQCTVQKQTFEMNESPYAQTAFEISARNIQYFSEKTFSARITGEMFSPPGPYPHILRSRAPSICARYGLGDMFCRCYHGYTQTKRRIVFCWFLSVLAVSQWSPPRLRQRNAFCETLLRDISSPPARCF